MAKGRQARGERVGGSKLTSQQVARIRDLLALGIRGVDIARRYSVNPSLVSSIKHGKVWNHVE